MCKVKFVKNDELREFVIVMLGSPAIKIELNEHQLDLAIDFARERVVTTQVAEDDWPVLIKEGALIYAKKILGRIRSKFSGLPHGVTLDGPMLLDEAEREMKVWEHKLGGCCV